VPCREAHDKNLEQIRPLFPIREGEVMPAQAMKPMTLHSMHEVSALEQFVICLIVGALVFLVAMTIHYELWNPKSWRKSRMN